MFGKLRTGSTLSDNDFAFAGEQRDHETENSYLRARYYDSDTGRFTTKDPLPGSVGSPQSLNPYGYVGNNPVNRTDPTGMGGIGACAAVQWVWTGLWGGGEVCVAYVWEGNEFWSGDVA